MKKLITIILTSCLLLWTFVPVNATTGVSEDAGISISEENYYKMEKTLSALPMTYEATICIPKEYYENTEPAFILSNYRDTGMYLKINKWGQPMLYYNYELPGNTDEARVDIFFNKCNVMTGNWIHLAITYEPTTKTFYCYLNGVLKQSIVTTGDISYAPNSPFFIGKDNRTAHGWKEDIFFKGKIRNLTLFYDTRTAEEIANDYISVDTSD